MQQFQVPQFIDVEDKLFGPFTIKQFVYVAGGGGMVYLFFQLLPRIPAFVISAPVAGLALALAFKKINGQPFIKIIQAFIVHQISGKMYLWQKDYSKIEQPQEVQKVEKEEDIPVRPTNNLNKLSWSLNVLDDSKDQSNG